MSLYIYIGRYVYMYIWHIFDIWCIWHMYIYIYDIWCIWHIYIYTHVVIRVITSLSLTKYESSRQMEFAFPQSDRTSCAIGPWAILSCAHWILLRCMRRLPVTFQTLLVTFVWCWFMLDTGRPDWDTVSWDACCTTIISALSQVQTCRIATPKHILVVPMLQPSPDSHQPMGPWLPAYLCTGTLYVTRCSKTMPTISSLSSALWMVGLLLHDQ